MAGKGRFSATMLGLVLFTCLLFYAEGRPNKHDVRHHTHRYRRDDDVSVNGLVYAPCKDTYSQCGEWKKTGMCEMAQYKDYMPLVCTETCGFCKANQGVPLPAGPLVTAPVVSEPVAASPGQKDKIQEDYEEQLQKYYQNLAKQQEAYQASVAPAKTEAATPNSGVPATDAAAAPSADAATSSAPAPAAYQTPYQYGQQYQQQYPYAYNPAAQTQPGGYTTSSSSIGSSSSSTSSVNNDISASAGSPPSSNLTPTNTSGNATVPAALPPKVAPETPSLPALPTLLSLPPISESLLLDDAKNGSSSIDKEGSDITSEKEKQEADSKPYAPEQTNTTTTTTTTTTPAADDTKKEAPKEEAKEESKNKAPATTTPKEDTKSASKASKATSEDASTNESSKSESKHIPAASRQHSAAVDEENNNEEDADEDEDDDDGKDGDQEIIAKAFSGGDKKKAVAGKGKGGKESSEDEVYKHDEKSVTEGSGGAGLEEGVDTDDLNYITDFNPDDFDMDVDDISRHGLRGLHDKRDRVELPKNHPLYSRSGIQKARSDITAPHIIDATEDGVGDTNLLAATKSKVTVAKLIKPAKKEEVSKATDDQTPSEVDAKFFAKKGGDDGEDAEDEEDEEEGDGGAEDGAEEAEKKSNLKKKDTVKVQKTAKKRTKDDDDKDDAIIADLSGAGSGETDTDMLSGDTRSLEDASGDADIADADEEEEDSDDSEDAAHARQNLQLHGDPEMVDLKPKEPKIQPDLNDFPDKDDSKTSFHADSKPEKAAEKEPGKEDADKKTSSPDEAELDDIKIEELLNPKPEGKKKKKTTAKKAKESSNSQMEKGKISLVLQQNFNVLYEKLDSPSYQMLAGNIKKDIEKMIPGTDVNDVAFSEVSVEGNPRQSGKTKANFNLKAPTNEWMKDLLKLVDGGDIDGLRVIKGSLEIEESE